MKHPCCEWILVHDNSDFRFKYCIFESLFSCDCFVWQYNKIKKIFLKCDFFFTFGLFYNCTKMFRALNKKLLYPLQISDILKRLYEILHLYTFDTWQFLSLQKDSKRESSLEYVFDYLSYPFELFQACMSFQ